jgi:zinc transport system permease protein
MGSFMLNALLAGLLSSILFGVLGSVVTVKRIAGLAGAISHAVLGGIGLALFLAAQSGWLIRKGAGVGGFGGSLLECLGRLVAQVPPIAGALLFAVLAAVIIGLVSLRAKQREDTVINAIWAIGMSIGVLFMAKTPGYTDPTSYLFGNILLISPRDLWLLGGLDLLVLFLAWRFYPQLKALSFDEEFARVRGVRTHAVFMILLMITAVAVVLLQTFVGIVMLIAMLTLPAGTAGYRARSLAGMMLGATLLSALFSTGGLAAGWFLDTPPGATTVVMAGAVFLAAALVRMIRRRLK